MRACIFNITNFMELKLYSVLILIPPGQQAHVHCTYIKCLMLSALFKRHFVVSRFIFHFPQLEPIEAASMIGGHELWEGDESVLVAVVLLQHLVNDLHRPPKPHPLSGFCVLS